MPGLRQRFWPHWSDHPPILPFLRAHAAETDPPLPCEPARAPGELKFAPGALDGLRTYHTRIRPLGKLALIRIAMALDEAAASDRPARLRTLYRLLVRRPFLEIADEVTAFANSLPAGREGLKRVARWLLRNAAHKEAFKAGIALVGELGDESDMDDLMTAGRHSEFAQFAEVAILKLAKAPADALWALAKVNNSWGRIHAVERLAEMAHDRPDIQQWLLRHGFRNDVMDEYLAHACAVAGGLEQHLRGSVDEELFEASLDLTVALIEGGPAQDVRDYEPAVLVLTRILELANAREPSARVAFWASIVLLHKDKLAHGGGASELVSGCGAYLARPELAAVLSAEFARAPEGEWRQAWAASLQSPVNLWPALIRRLEAGHATSDLVLYAANDAVPEYAPRLIAWAESALPAAEGGQGPDGFDSGHVVGYLLQNMPERLPLSLKLLGFALARGDDWSRRRAVMVLDNLPPKEWWSALQPDLRAALHTAIDRANRRDIKRVLKKARE